MKLSVSAWADRHLLKAVPGRSGNAVEPWGACSNAKQRPGGKPLSREMGNDIWNTPLVSAFAGCIKKAKIIGVKCLLSFIFIVFKND